MGLYILQTLFYWAWWLAGFSNVEPLFGWFLVASTLTSFVLEIAVIYELWNRLVLSRSSAARIFQPWLRWSAAALLLLGTAVAALLPQNVAMHAMQLYSTLNVSLNLLDLGLLIALFVVSRLTAISWGILPAGAALGIAVNDVGGATAATLMNHIGTRFILDTILEGAFALSAIVWLTSVFLCANAENAQELRWAISDDDSPRLEQLNSIFRG